MNLILNGRPLWRGLLFFLMTMVAASAAQALTVVSRSFDELVALADTIVIATAGEARSTWSDDGNAILTRYTLEDIELIKGEVPSAPFELPLPGGIVGEDAQFYPGVPQLQRGERYVLFLYDRDFAGFLPLVGVHQGLYRVLRDAAGEQRVLPERSVPPSTAAGVIMLPHEAQRLDDFLGAIRQRLDSAAPASDSDDRS
jgi:hypothetical protein